MEPGSSATSPAGDQPSDADRIRLDFTRWSDSFDDWSYELTPRGSEPAPQRGEPNTVLREWVSLAARVVLNFSTLIHQGVGLETPFIEFAHSQLRECLAARGTSNARVVLRDALLPLLSQLVQVNPGTDSEPSIWRELMAVSDRLRTDEELFDVSAAGRNAVEYARIEGPLTKLEQIIGDELRDTTDDGEPETLASTAFRESLGLWYAAVQAVMASIRSVPEAIITELASTIELNVQNLIGSKAQDGSGAYPDAGSNTAFTHWLEQAGKLIASHWPRYALSDPWLNIRVRQVSVEASAAIRRATQSTISAAQGRQQSLLNDTVEASHQARSTVARALDIVDDMRQARDETLKAAGKVGAGSLAKRYARYSAQNRTAAWVFRITTIALLVAIVSLAIAFAISAESQLAGAGGQGNGLLDWRLVVYRLALLAGLTGLAAYLGRQASHHRRLADWAKSLEVQLRGFYAFVTPITHEETANAVRLAFATRVLGSPPEKPAAPETTNPAQSILEAVVKAR